VGRAVAPASFGEFGGDLLVGNFGDGRIDAFNLANGAFIDTLRDAAGNPIGDQRPLGTRFRKRRRGF